VFNTTFNVELLKMLNLHRTFNANYSTCWIFNVFWDDSTRWIVSDVEFCL